MSLSLQAAGVRIAEDLDVAEQSANECLRNLAKLQHSMMNARIDSDLAPYEGQAAVTRIQAAMANLVDAQGDIARAHAAMRKRFIELADIPDTNGRCPTAAIETQDKVAA